MGDGLPQFEFLDDVPRLGAGHVERDPVDLDRLGTPLFSATLSS
jgi:hypothetical protein